MTEYEELKARAKANGATPWQIQKLRKFLGVPARRSDPISDKKKARIYKDSRTGLYNLKELGERHGVSPSAVSKILTKGLRKK